MNASTLTKPASSQPAPVSGLPVGGIIPFSATDWPGHLTVTVFTRGCPLRCTYCHNPELQDFAEPAYAPSFDEALSLLQARRGLLDGMVISGGEPLAAPGLARAAARVRQAGFGLGLHTSGYVPRRLATLLRDPQARPDWIGFDVKALPEHLPQVAGCTPATAARMWESLALLGHAARAYGTHVQLRTTLWANSIIETHLEQLREQVRLVFGALPDGSYPGLVIQHARDVDAAGYYHGPGRA